jgi:hypothetical protein
MPSLETSPLVRATLRRKYVRSRKMALDSCSRKMVARFDQGDPKNMTWQISKIERR